MSGRAGAIARAVRAELRVALMLALQYRASFLGEAVMATMWVLWLLLPLFVVFRFRSGVGGWGWDAALLVTGFFLTLEGLLGAFVAPNLRAVVEQVRQGTLDFVLLKPIDTQLLVSVHRTDPTRLPHALAGLIVIGVASARLPQPPGPTQLLAGALLLGVGISLLYSLWTIAVSTSFWFVRIDNLAVLLQSLLDAGRWPLGFYRGAVRFLLTFVFPVGLMTTWPALALLGLLEPVQLAQALGVAASFLVVSRLVWTTALRRYASASS